MVSISHNRPLRQLEEDYREHEDPQLVDSLLSVLHVNGALIIRPKHSNPTPPEADRLTDREMEVLSLVAEGFSNKTIVPDVTTVEDLNWWFRHRMLDLHIEKENHPTIGIQRRPANIEKYADEDPPEFFRRGRTDNGMNVVIRRGDIVSLDSDIMLLGMVTDSHQHAYVLEEGETDVPEGLKEALRIVNRMQDLFAAEFVYGRTGIQIRQAADRIPHEPQHDRARPSAGGTHRGLYHVSVRGHFLPSTSARLTRLRRDRRDGKARNHTLHRRGDEAVQRDRDGFRLRDRRGPGR